MRNIEVSRDMLFTLKEKSFSSDLEGKYGVVFPFGNKVIKMDKFAINEIVHSKTICFNPKRNQTYDLLHDLINYEAYSYDTICFDKDIKENKTQGID